MNSMKVKDLREIARSNELRKSEFVVGNYLVEVCEDDCEDLVDFDCSFTRRVTVSESGATIEVCEDNCKDLPDGW